MIGSLALQISHTITTTVIESTIDNIIIDYMNFLQESASEQTRKTSLKNMATSIESLLNYFLEKNYAYCQELDGKLGELKSILKSAKSLPTDSNYEKYFEQIKKIKEKVESIHTALETGVTNRNNNISNLTKFVNFLVDLFSNLVSKVKSIFGVKSSADPIPPNATLTLDYAYQTFKDTNEILNSTRHELSERYSARNLPI